MQFSKKNILIIPNVKVYSLSAGGVREHIYEWANVAKNNLTEHVGTYFKDLGQNVKIINTEKLDDEKIENIIQLCLAVMESIHLHVNGPYPFPKKENNFDYSIGAIDYILDSTGTDSMIIIYGRDEISTPGRKIMNGIGTFFGATIGVFNGFKNIPSGGTTKVSIAIIDPAGTIQWIGRKKNDGGYDLRNSESTYRLASEILSPLSGRGE